MKRVETRRTTRRNRQITRPLDRPVANTLDDRGPGTRLGTPPRGIASDNPHWFVEVGLDVVDEPAGQVWNGALDSRFHLYVYPEEWGYFFCHGSRSSWIRVADAVRVHGADDYALASHTPPLRDLSAFVRDLEIQHRIKFRRDHALIRSNIDEAEEAVRGWLVTL